MPTAPYQYPSNPAPQSGQGIFGSVPGPISLPSPFSDLSNVYPNLSGTNAQVSGVIGSQLAGQLSPQVLSNLQNQAATFAAGSGQPGSNAIPGTLANNNNLLGNIRTTEQLQQQGLQNYNQLIPTISGTQTVNPALQTEVAGTNALFGAAPNPSQAASYAQSLFDQYLSALSGPAGGTGAFRGGGGGGGPTTGSTPYSGPGGSPYSVFSSIPGTGGGLGSSPTWMASSLNLPGSYLTGSPSTGTYTPPPDNNYDPYAAFGGYNDPGAATMSG